jgi:starch synthase
MFFARGVAETVKKLGWQPDIIHCHGWFTSLLPLYIKKYYNDDPIFADSKLVVSLYNDTFPKSLNKKLSQKLSFDGFNKKDIKHVSEDPSFTNMLKQAIEFSDGVIQGSDTISDDLVKHIKKTGKPFLGFKDELEYMDAFNEFYDDILAEAHVS